MMRETIARFLSAEHALARYEFEAIGDTLRTSQWPTIGISVGEVQIFRKHANVCILHSHIEFNFNVDMPEGKMHTCVTGVGTSEEEAAAEAAQVWAVCWAPPLFSVLHASPVLNVEWIQRSDSRGIPDWDAFVSPYFARGSAYSKTILSKFLEEESLLDSVRELLPSQLMPTGIISTISLFRSPDIGEVQIDAKTNAILSERLAKSRFPSDDGWMAVRQCLVVINSRLK
jgi:hypothetical protein